MKIVISEVISIPNGAPASLKSMLSGDPQNMKLLTLQPAGGSVAIGPDSMTYAGSVKLVADSVFNIDVGTRAGTNEIDPSGIFLDGAAGGITMNIIGWD